MPLIRCAFEKLFCTPGALFSTLHCPSFKPSRSIPFFALFPVYHVLPVIIDVLDNLPPIPGEASNV